MFPYLLQAQASTLAPYGLLSQSNYFCTPFSLNCIPTEGFANLVFVNFNGIADLNCLSLTEPELEQPISSNFGPVFHQESPNREKQKDEQKKVRPKKNVESNISNQVFSFITNKVKCLKALERVLRDSEKVQLYFQYIEQFVKSKKKYLSRKYLGDLCTFSDKRKESDEIEKMKKLDVLSLEEFRAALGYLVFHYLRSKCTSGVLTSIKLSSELRREHLERKREILAYLEEYVQPDPKHRRNHNYKY